MSLHNKDGLGPGRALCFDFQIKLIAQWLHVVTPSYLSLSRTHGLVRVPNNHCGNGKAFLTLNIYLWGLEGCTCYGG